MSIGICADAGVLNTGGSVDVNVANNGGLNALSCHFPPCNPTLKLPSDPIVVNIEYAENTYFNMTLSNVPTDKNYYVADGIYPGWCAQNNVVMTRGVDINIQLYSSYDPNMPDAFKSDNWGLVNYLINHRAGYTRMDVQNVIWYLLGSPADIPSGSPAETLLHHVQVFGVGFCPKPGDRIAILCDKITTEPEYQRCFIEVVIPIPVCTRTLGYWKNHACQWPVNQITIGGQTYTKTQAINLMNQYWKQDKTYLMFAQLVSTKLNLIRGTDSECLGDTVAQADAWMTAHPPGSHVYGNSQAWKIGEPLEKILDNYNNGRLCAPHCGCDD